MAAVAGGLAAGVALTVGIAGVNRGTHATQRIRRVAETVPSDLASSYRFLISAASTTPPGSLGRDLGLVGAGYGVSPSLGRDAGSVGAQHLWMVPGSSGSCLWLAGGGSACGPNALIARQGVWLMLVPVSGTAPTVYGIVPNGATVAGEAANVVQSGNAVMVTPSSSRAGRFTVRTQRGATVSMTVPATTGHPQ